MRESKPRSITNRTCKEREFFVDNLLVRIHFIIVMIRRTGLATRTCKTTRVIIFVYVVYLVIYDSG